MTADALFWLRFKGGRLCHITRARPYSRRLMSVRPLCGANGEYIAELAPGTLVAPGTPCKACLVKAGWSS